MSVQLIASHLYREFLSDYPDVSMLYVSIGRTNEFDIITFISRSMTREYLINLEEELLPDDLQDSDDEIMPNTNSTVSPVVQSMLKYDMCVDILPYTRGDNNG